MESFEKLSIRDKYRYVQDVRLGSRDAPEEWSVNSYRKNLREGKEWRQRLWSLLSYGCHSRKGEESELVYDICSQEISVKLRRLALKYCARNPRYYSLIQLRRLIEHASKKDGRVVLQGLQKRLSPEEYDSFFVHWRETGNVRLYPLFAYASKKFVATLDIGFFESIDTRGWKGMARNHSEVALKNLITLVERTHYSDPLLYTIVNDCLPVIKGSKLLALRDVTTLCSMILKKFRLESQRLQILSRLAPLLNSHLVELLEFIETNALAILYDTVPTKLDRKIKAKTLASIISCHHSILSSLNFSGIRRSIWAQTLWKELQPALKGQKIENIGLTPKFKRFIALLPFEERHKVLRLANGIPKDLALYDYVLLYPYDDVLKRWHKELNKLEDEWAIRNMLKLLKELHLHNPSSNAQLCDQIETFRVQFSRVSCDEAIIECITSLPTSRWTSETFAQLLFAAYDRMCQAQSPDRLRKTPFNQGEKRLHDLAIKCIGVYDGFAQKWLRDLCPYGLLFSSVCYLPSGDSAIDDILDARLKEDLKIDPNLYVEYYVDIWANIVKVLRQGGKNVNEAKGWEYFPKIYDGHKLTAELYLRDELDKIVACALHRSRPTFDLCLLPWLERDVTALSVPTVCRWAARERPDLFQPLFEGSTQFTLQALGDYSIMPYLPSIWEGVCGDHLLSSLTVKDAECHDANQEHVESVHDDDEDSCQGPTGPIDPDVFRIIPQLPGLLPSYVIERVRACNKSISWISKRIFYTMASMDDLRALDYLVSQIGGDQTHEVSKHAVYAVAPVVSKLFPDDAVKYLKQMTPNDVSSRKEILRIWGRLATEESEKMLKDVWLDTSCHIDIRAAAAWSLLAMKHIPSVREFLTEQLITETRQNIAQPLIDTPVRVLTLEGRLWLIDIFRRKLEQHINVHEVTWRLLNAPVGDPTHTLESILITLLQEKGSPASYIVCDLLHYLEYGGQREAEILELLVKRADEWMSNAWSNSYLSHDIWDQLITKTLHYAQLNKDVVLLLRMISVSKRPSAIIDLIKNADKDIKVLLIEAVQSNSRFLCHVNDRKGLADTLLNETDDDIKLIGLCLWMREESDTKAKQKKLQEVQKTATSFPLRSYIAQHLEKRPQHKGVLASILPYTPAKSAAGQSRRDVKRHFNYSADVPGQYDFSRVRDINLIMI